VTDYDRPVRFELFGGGRLAFDAGGVDIDGPLGSPDAALCLRQQSAQRHSTIALPSGPRDRVSRQPYRELISV
jgi:hypothetical protein